MFHRAAAFIRSVIGRRRLERDMDDEMRFHIESYEQDLVRAGTPSNEAHRQAQLHFGGLQGAKEACLDAKGISPLDELARNVRYAVRLLRRSPGFTVSVVLTLALCIGANTAVFSVVDAMLFRRLPYPEPERLGEIVREVLRGSLRDASIAQDGYAWEALKDGQSYDLAANSGTNGVNLGVDNRAIYVQQQRVTAGYFRVLGVPPSLGREFLESEDRPGGAQVVVLSDGLWKRAFHEDAGIVGRSILLRGEPYTVVGVAAPGFRTNAIADLWTPLRPSTSGEGAGTNYEFAARLRPAASWAQAQTEVETRGASAFARMKLPPDVSVRMTILPFQHYNKTWWRERLMILWAAVGCVLLIGCVNVASLMLARGWARRREMGTRIALGGGPGSLVRQLTTEAIVLGLLGGVVGLAAGYAAIAALDTVARNYGIWQELRLDARVFAGMAALALLTSLLFGIAPALQAARTDVRGTLLEQGSRAVAGGRSHWLRRALVLTEVALGLVLLIGSGLLVRTLLHLQNLNPGFDGSNVLTASASLQDARYNGQRINQLFRDTLERIRKVPGVETAAVGLHAPYQRWLNTGIKVRSSANAEARQAMTTMNYVSPGYFDALRIPLRAGRAIDERDTETSTPVAMVNETFVRKLLHVGDGVGSYIEASSGPSQLIVGVVGDLQQRPGLSGTGPLDREPAVYVPVTQMQDRGFQIIHTWFSPNWIVRANGPRAQIVQGIEQAIASVDPLLPVASFRSMEDERDRALASQRLNAYLLGSVAALALLLACVGVYGMVANSVVERTREFGIRMALGATATGTIWTAAMPGIALATAGAVIGAMLAAAGAKMLKGMLYGVQPIDPPTFVAVAVALVLVSAIASLAPAISLVRLDPAKVLRQD